MSGFEEVVPGVWDWVADHPGIGQPVHSHYVEPAAAVIDPMAPDGLPELLRDRPVEQVLLTNRHHYRGSGVVAGELGCPVRCPEPGLHEFEGGPEVGGYRFGELVAPGVRAHEVGAICPDEAALHIDAGDGLLALADGLVELGGELSFVPDFLMDEPERTKAGLLSSFERLLELDFDALLLAHGNPVPSGGKAALAEFVRAGGRQAPFP